ncbi:MFS transporter [Bacillus sp. IT-79MI2]
MLKGLKGYIVLMITEKFSNLGSSLTTFVLAYWAWTTFGEPGAIAKVTISFFLPMVIAQSIAGVFVDRLNRKMILISTNTLLVCLMLLLAFLMKSGGLLTWHIYLVAIIHAICTAFRNPTLIATMGMMVDRSKLAKVSGLNQSLNAAAFIGGPLIGGILIGFVGGAGLLVIDACTFLVSVIGAIVVAIPNPTSKISEKNNKLNLFREVWGGAQFIKKNPSLLALIASSTVFSLFGSFLVVLLLPMSSLFWEKQPGASFIADVLGNLGSTASSFDAQVSGAMNAILFLGVCVGGIIMASWNGFKNRVLSIMIGLVVAGASQAMVSNENLLIAGFALFVCGLMGPLYNATCEVIYLNKTPPELQGRVFSLITLLGQITYPLGLTLVGLLGKYYQPNILLLWSGIASVVAVILFFMISSLRYVDQVIPDHKDQCIDRQVSDL